MVMTQRGTASMSRRRWLVGTASLAGAVLAACARSGGQQGVEGLVVATPTPAAGAAEATPAATATPIFAEAGRGGTVINFWNGLTGADGAGMVRLMQRYAEQKKDVTGKIQMIAWRTFYDKLS